MDKIACEMCGSNDLIKNDGIYVCQHCGMHYTPEEAKKLMVSGTVKIDNSDFVEKYLQNARRAKAKEDWEETEKYYNLVEQNDPSNIEAIFYSSYGKAKSSLTDGDLYKRQAAFKVLNNCVSILDENFDMEKEESQREIIKQISDDIVLMSGSNYVFNQRKNGYGIVTWTDKEETVSLFSLLNHQFCESLEEIIKKYPEGDSRLTFYYQLLILHYSLPTTLYKSRVMTATGQQKLQKYHEEFHKLDPSHEIPLPSDIKKQGGNSGGCYVATAVYGSYNCPQVWTLRRYRDYTLAETWYGRLFIKTYYATSPTLVKWFGKTEWFRTMFRGKLDSMVKNLNEKGVDNTPYIDKEW